MFENAIMQEHAPIMMPTPGAQDPRIGKSSDHASANVHP
jgi:hypothetical protein